MSCNGPAPLLVDIVFFGLFLSGFPLKVLKRLCDSFSSSTDVRSHDQEWYMNELRPHLNENDPKDRITKKDLKELKVATYTNNVQLPFW